LRPWQAALAAAAALAAWNAPAARAGDVGTATPGLIAFSYGVEGRLRVATIAPDGTGRQTLIERAEGPAWSLGGRSIAYAAVARRGRGGGLRVARADGSRRRVVTRHGDVATGSDMAPAWAPDGRTLVFHRWTSRGEGAFEATVHSVRRDGTRLRRLARGLFPAWSPRGRIAFVRQIAPVAPFTAGIYTLRPDGSGLRRLTGDSRDSAPDWSPHGLHIAFTRAGAVYRMRADGSGVTRLARRGMDPAWSPDGRHIVFSRGDALWVMRANGTELRRLTPPLPNRELYAPDWQPLTPR